MSALAALTLLLLAQAPAAEGDALVGGEGLEEADVLAGEELEGADAVVLLEQARIVAVPRRQVRPGPARAVLLVKWVDRWSNGSLRHHAAKLEPDLLRGRD